MKMTLYYAWTQIDLCLVIQSSPKMIRHYNGNGATKIGRLGQRYQSNEGSTSFVIQKENNSFTRDCTIYRLALHTSPRNITI